MQKVRPNSYTVLDIPLVISNLNEVTDLLLSLASRKTRGYVCALSVHAVTLSQSDTQLFKALHSSLFNCPDGRPLTWIGKIQGLNQVYQIRGTDLFYDVFRKSANTPLRHFLYGGKPGVAEKLKARLEKWHPGIKVVGLYCPPFRDLTSEEEEKIKKQLEVLKPDFFWVGLGTPKQENFCARFSGEWNSGIMISVGAAFDFHSGGLSDSPIWVQRAGLQWFHRLLIEPKRLWKRYLILNPLFLFLIVRQLISKGLNK